MKHEETARFLADFRALTSEERNSFLQAVRELNEAFEGHHRERGHIDLRKWPKKLRIKDVKGARGIWELTWSWPNGRATFEFTEVAGETGIRWRRIGTHRIFKEP